VPLADLKPGDVIKAFDREIDPANWKRLICICPTRRLFLRINSNPLWTPHIRVLQADSADCLDWDSFVELRQLVRIGIRELRQALLRPENPLGHLPDKVCREIAFAAFQAATLSDDNRRLIWENLVGDANAGQ